MRFASPANKTMNKKFKGVLLFVIAGVLLLPLLAQFRRLQPPLNAQTLPSYRPQSGPVPRFVTYHLGGVNLIAQKWDSDYEGRCDPKSRYCLSSANGPDGCEYIMNLSPGFERDEQYWSVSRSELEKEFKGVRVPLITGRGVRIGDTPRQVQRKIGKPTSQSIYKSETLYVYEYRGKRLYDARYTFPNGKLRSIYFRDARPPNKTNGFKPSGGCM